MSQYHMCKTLGSERALIIKVFQKGGKHYVDSDPATFECDNKADVAHAIGKLVANVRDCQACDGYTYKYECNNCD